MDKKKIIGIALCAIALVILIVTFVGGGSKITELERIKITEVSDVVMNYIEYVDTKESKDIDRYINYALVYNLNENNDNTLKTKEVKEIVEKVFNKKVSKKDIESIGISPLLLNNNVTYDYNTTEFKLENSKKTLRDIAEKQITVYSIDEINKKKDSYVVTYNKYVVKNPYEVLNYYNDKNNNVKVDKDGKVVEDKNKKKIDTTEINKYLEGKETEKTFRKYITKDFLEEKVKKSTKVEVTYVVVDDNILIDSIK